MRFCFKLTFLRHVSGFDCGSWVIILTKRLRRTRRNLKQPISCFYELLGWPCFVKINGNKMQHVR